MAEAASPLETLAGETSCPICLSYYTDPVSTPCGHNFCRPCLLQCFEALDADFQCPQCRKVFSRRLITPNRQLENIVQVAKELGRQEALSRALGKCERHGDPLKLFCRKEQRGICLVCRESREHRAHEVVLLEEAADEFKEKIKKWVNSLKQEKNEIQEHQASVEQRAIALKNQVATEKQKTMTEFDRLYTKLRNEEQTILSKLEEMDRNIVVARNANVAKLSGEISHLGDLIKELEKKLGLTAYEFLKDVKNDLKRCENVNFRKPEEKRKNYKVFVTMDPNTAHHLLVLSADRRHARLEEVTSPAEPGMFRLPTPPFPVCVLGCEAFTSGRHYWEVVVSGGRGWSVGGLWRVGVARQSAQNINVTHSPAPNVGIWAVEKRRQGGHYQALTLPPTPLSLRGNPKKIGVYLDHRAGQLSFFNADSNEHIYTFRHCFHYALVPYFGMCSETELSLA